MTSPLRSIYEIEETSTESTTSEEPSTCQYTEGVMECLGDIVLKTSAMFQPLYFLFSHTAEPPVSSTNSRGRRDLTDRLAHARTPHGLRNDKLKFSNETRPSSRSPLGRNTGKDSRVRNPGWTRTHDDGILDRLNQTRLIPLTNLSHEQLQNTDLETACRYRVTS